MECYLEEIIKDTTIKQNANETLASSEMQTETVDQLVICCRGQYCYAISK